MVEALSSLMRRSNRDGYIQPSSIVDKVAMQHSVDALVSFCCSDMLVMHIHMLRAPELFWNVLPCAIWTQEYFNMQGAVIYAETVVIITTATSQSQVRARLYSPASCACVIPYPTRPAQSMFLRNGALSAL